MLRRSKRIANNHPDVSVRNTAVLRIVALAREDVYAQLSDVNKDLACDKDMLLSYRSYLAPRIDAFNESFIVEHQSYTAAAKQATIQYNAVIDNDQDAAELASDALLTLTAINRSDSMRVQELGDVLFPWIMQWKGTVIPMRQLCLESRWAKTNHTAALRLFQKSVMRGDPLDAQLDCVRIVYKWQLRWRNAFLAEVRFGSHLLMHKVGHQVEALLEKRRVAWGKF